MNTEPKLIEAWGCIRYFNPKEFDDPTSPGSGYSMNIEFVKILDTIRTKLNFSMSIDSGFRTLEHNKLVGGKTDSAHMEGVAADISCYDSDKRFELVKLALANNICRIGIGDSFIHLDISLTLPQNVIWLYPQKATATNQNPLVITSV